MRRLHRSDLSRFVHRCRVAVLVAIGGWLVHQLRYTLAVGHESAAHAEAHGHQYLDFTWPLLLGAIALALGSWIFSLGRERLAVPDSPSGEVVWIRASLALIAIFCAQEAAEGLFAPHHPELIAGIFGSGGWIALPLSVVIGGAIALALRGARAAREAVARAVDPPAADSAPRPLFARPLEVRQVRSDVLARKLAGRAPPVAA